MEISIFFLSLLIVISRRLIRFIFDIDLKKPFNMFKFRFATGYNIGQGANVPR